MSNFAHVNVGSIGHIDYDRHVKKSPLHEVLMQSQQREEDDCQPEADDFSDTYNSFGRGRGIGSKTPPKDARKKLLARRKRQRLARKQQRIKK